MSPDEWARMTSYQQADHIQRWGPPPASWNNRAPVAAPPPPRRSRRGWLIGLGVIVLLFVIIVSHSGQSTPASPAGTSGGSAALPAAVANAGPPHATSARDWAKIAKDPDSHKGEALIVYGQVTQFDSATGTASFRANVDGIQHPASDGFADYETNTILDNGGTDLSNLVNKDIFRAEVVVVGSESYTTTLGGSTTVPELGVTKIAVIGSAT